MEENIKGELKDCEAEEVVKEDKDLDDDNEIVNKLKKENDNLVNENEKLQNEIKAKDDRLVRIVAEYDNYRKRTDKEKEGIYTNACEDILKEILPVLDNLERALLVEGEADDIKTGVDMTMKQFKDTLCKLGVEEISTDEGFDPNFHNAVMHIEDENFGNNEVAEVFLKGYKKGDRVIRHSMVKVAN